MCSACEGKAPEPRVAVDLALVHRARDIERTMAGEKVPDMAWDVFFGFAGGAVEYRHYQRIHEAYEQAERTQIRLRPGLRHAVAPADYQAAV